MTFRITLTEKRIKPHQTTALHLIPGFVFLAAGGMFLQSGTISGLCYLIPGAALVLFSLLRNRSLQHPRTGRTVRIAEIILTLVLTLHLLYRQDWLPAAGTSVLIAGLGAALYWEHFNPAPLRVIIDKNGISFPFRLQKRLRPWPEIERVVLRFGVLTIDFADNHLLQWHVLPAGFPAEELEAFCAEQIAEGRTRRQTDW